MYTVSWPQSPFIAQGNNPLHSTNHATLPHSLEMITPSGTSVFLTIWPYCDSAYHQTAMQNAKSQALFKSFESVLLSGEEFSGDQANAYQLSFNDHSFSLKNTWGDVCNKINLSDKSIVAKLEPSPRSQAQEKCVTLTNLSWRITNDSLMHMTCINVSGQDNMSTFIAAFKQNVLHKLPETLRSMVKWSWVSDALLSKRLFSNTLSNVLCIEELSSRRMIVDKPPERYACATFVLSPYPSKKAVEEALSVFTKTSFFWHNVYEYDANDDLFAISFKAYEKIERNMVLPDEWICKLPSYFQNNILIQEMRMTPKQIENWLGCPLAVVAAHIPIACFS